MNATDILKRMFPNASESCVRSNTESPRPAPKLERNTRNATLGKKEKKGRDTRLYLVRITSVRKRLLDWDNLCGKYHTDVLRYASALPGDAPNQTKIKVSQRKAREGEEEHVMLRVDIVSPEEFARY